MSLEDLFEFNSSWVFGLVIIACILALFFVGCIFAIVSDFLKIFIKSWKNPI